MARPASQLRPASAKLATLIMIVSLALLMREAKAE
jgi:hypothetical protein